VDALMREEDKVEDEVKCTAGVATLKVARGRARFVGCVACSEDFLLLIDLIERRQQGSTSGNTHSAVSDDSIWTFK
jgi:hypothetical protein